MIQTAFPYQLFDPLTEDEFTALKEDIRLRGVLVPVEYDEHGNILDGHHRVRAWEELCAEGVQLADYARITRPNLTEEQKRNHVRALNLLRRHLSKDKRAAVFAEMRADGMTLQEIADVTGVDASTVKRNLDATFASAKVDVPTGTKGKDGKVRPKKYKKRKIGTHGVVSGSAKQQEQVQTALSLVDVETGEILGADEVVREAKKVEQAETRQHKVNDIAELSEELGVFPVIYADPPWRYEHVKTENRAIENQYPTMALEEICALSVPVIAAPNCVLFLWATSPKLAEAMRVIEAWGFTYRTCAVWVKDKIGMGYYFRQRHELLLVATRGELPVPEPSDRHDSVIEGERTEHSAKPVEFYEVIEAMYPEYRRIELFSRNPRLGWAGWGNQYGDQ